MTVISVGEDFPNQLARARTILSQYKEIGAAGQFGAIMIEATIQEADKAIAGGDIIEILRSYEALKQIE